MIIGSRIGAAMRSGC
ncbi:hypothetical protein LINPERHAP1_LOCUS6764 [Linum perenne]